jgi:hypothetical protein
MSRATSKTGKRLARLMRKRGWYASPNNGLRQRLYSLATDHHPWWDWGHPLMILVGRDECGNWSEPRPETWWYRQGPPRRMWRTKYPRHPLSTYQVVTDYTEFRSLTEGLNEDQMYEWQAIYCTSDGDLSLGRRYWGGNFYGLSKADCALLRRYLRAWRRLDWWGLRSWLYAQGLHAAVYTKKPFACNHVPPRGQGGYDHWHCKLKRGHDGMHRVGSYVWGEIGGETIGAMYDPEHEHEVSS